MNKWAMMHVMTMSKRRRRVVLSDEDAREFLRRSRLPGLFERIFHDTDEPATHKAAVFGVCAVPISPEEGEN